MKSIAICLAFAVILCSAALADSEFYFKTTPYSKSALKPWIAGHPMDYAGTYSGEFGDGGGEFVLAPYPIEHQTGKTEFRYSGVLIIGSVASRPGIKVFEQRKITKGALESVNVPAHFYIFSESKGRKLRGVLIDGLFYAKSER